MGLSLGRISSRQQSTLPMSLHIDIEGTSSGSADQRIIILLPSHHRISGSADHRISGSADQRISGSADQRIRGSAHQRIRQPHDHKSAVWPALYIFKCRYRTYVCETVRFDADDQVAAADDIRVFQNIIKYHMISPNLMVDPHFLNMDSH